MANRFKIRRGSSIPTIDKLENFELGFCTNNGLLYINNNNNILTIGAELLQDIDDDFHPLNSTISADALYKYINNKKITQSINEESTNSLIPSSLAVYNFTKDNFVSKESFDNKYLPLTGGQLTGTLTAPRVIVTDNTYPTVQFVDLDDKKVKAQVLGNMDRNIVYFRNWCLDTEYYENYLTPDPDTELTSNKHYNLLTTKETKDFIVASGTSGIWTYRKWNSGLAECFCRVVISPTSFTENGGLFYTESFYFAYPFNFTSIKSNFSGSLNANVVGATFMGLGLDGATIRPLVTGNNPSTYTNRNLNLYIIGTWK